MNYNIIRNLDNNLVAISKNKNDFLKTIELIKKQDILNYYIIAIDTNKFVQYDHEIWNTIKQLIDENINNLTLKILLIDSNEGQTYKYDLFDMCDTLHNNFNIPYNNMIIIGIALHQFDSPVINCNLLTIAFCRESILNFKNITQEPMHHFVSLTRLPKKHRIIATIRLLEKNLEKHGYISCGCDSTNNELSLNNYNIIPKKFIDRFPMYIDGVIEQYSHKQTDAINEKINGAFINLVLETGFEDNIAWNVPVITEKSAKPFFWGQVPIFVSYHNTIPYIRKLGFDLFDDIIDHSYDNEINPTKRIFMAVKQLEKICYTPLDFWKKYKKSNLDRFINNRKIAEDLYNGGTYQLFKINFETALNSY